MSASWNSLQRLHEHGEIEIPNRGREDQFERRIGNETTRISDRSEGVTTEVDDLRFGIVRFERCEVRGSVPIYIHTLRRSRVGSLHQFVEEGPPIAKIVTDSERLDIGSVDKDEFRLNGDLRGRPIKTDEQERILLDAVTRIGDDQRIAGGVGDDRSAPTLHDRRQNRRQRRRRFVVHGIHHRPLRLERVTSGLEVRRLHHDDPGGLLHTSQAIGHQDLVERHIPRLVDDLR